ncbi:MAG TPA: LacI family DNA-binding transcriptional regulator [Woeseiaceae bacterium]|nr:LacI family DNA-binding transcriptional regulator [Woeseiaceae bacterium]
MKSDNPTSRDIANAAGVSQATVSRALRNSPLVRQDTRDRIHKIARELNYFVNRNAAGLRTHQSDTIALLLFEETKRDHSRVNPFFLSMLGNITRSAANLGYDVLVSFQDMDNDWHVQYQVSNRADGIILLGYGDYVSYREKLRSLSASNTRFIIWGPIIQDHPGHSIGCDNESGGFQATAHLASLGRKRIAFLGNVTKGSPEFIKRYRGYSNALKKANLAKIPELRVDADNEEQLGYQGALRLLDSGEPFDGLFAVTDLIAIGAIRALQDKGVNVPRDVSVVGFDDIPVASYVSPSLTTVQQNSEDASELLVGNLVKLIRNEPVKSTLMPPKLIVRQSCGASSF